MQTPRRPAAQWPGHGQARRPRGQARSWTRRPDLSAQLQREPGRRSAHQLTRQPVAAGPPPPTSAGALRSSTLPLFPTCLPRPSPGWRVLCPDPLDCRAAMAQMLDLPPELKGIRKHPALGDEEEQEHGFVADYCRDYAVLRGNRVAKAISDPDARGTANQMLGALLTVVESRAPRTGAVPGTVAGGGRTPDRCAQGVCRGRHPGPRGPSCCQRGRRPVLPRRTAAGCPERVWQPNPGGRLWRCGATFSHPYPSSPSLALSGGAGEGARHATHGHRCGWGDLGGTGCSGWGAHMAVRMRRQIVERRVDATKRVVQLRASRPAGVLGGWAGPAASGHGEDGPGPGPGPEPGTDLGYASGPA